jgi:hypothetical protein
MTLGKYSPYFIPILLLSLVSCGGSGDGDTVNNGTTTSDIYHGGKFYDGLVTGLQYDSGRGLEVVGAEGWYYFRQNKPITFYVGDIQIGQTTGREIITPFALVGVNDIANATVLNIARFLQSLDDDGNLTNGIAISQAVRAAAAGKTINFEQTTEQFNNDLNVISVVADLTNARATGQQTLISDSAAGNHLTDTMESLFARALQVFDGTSTDSQTNCTSPLFNVDSVAQGYVSLFEQYTTNETGVIVSGVANFTSEFQGVSIREEIDLSNVSIDFLGEMAGVAVTSVYVDDVFQDVSTSDFTGMLDGNNLTLQFPGETAKDVGSGITCDVAGKKIEVQGTFAP